MACCCCRPISPKPIRLPISLIRIDALDLHYRLRWAVRRAELDCHETRSGIAPSLVHERLRVLNWLTCFENAGWEAAASI